MVSLRLQENQEKLSDLRKQLALIKKIIKDRELDPLARSDAHEKRRRIGEKLKSLNKSRTKTAK